MVDEIRHQPTLHVLGLNSQRHIQPLKSPLLILMTPQERDEFRRRTDTAQKMAAARDARSAKTSQDQQARHRSITREILQKLPGKAFHKPENKSPGSESAESSKASSECGTPTQPGKRINVESLLNLPPADLLSLVERLAPLSPSARSEASTDSFIHVGSSSKASSHTGEHVDIRSLPDSSPGSPWLSLPSSPFMSKTHSRLLLTQPALEPEPSPQKHEDSDSEGDEVEESTETLKA